MRHPRKTFTAIPTVITCYLYIDSGPQPRISPFARERESSPNEKPGWQMGVLVAICVRQGGYGDPLIFLAMVAVAAAPSVRVFHHYLIKGDEGVARPGLIASLKAGIRKFKG